VSLAIFCSALAATVILNLLAVKTVAAHEPIVPDLPAE
jgi:hypothetical protein